MSQRTVGRVRGGQKLLGWEKLLPPVSDEIKTRDGRRVRPTTRRQGAQKEGLESARRVTCVEGAPGGPDGRKRGTVRLRFPGSQPLSPFVRVE